MTEQTPFKFRVGDKVEKVGGSYQAEGIIAAAFKTRKGENRYVFDFDDPEGILHIFGEKQLEPIKQPKHKKAEFELTLYDNEKNIEKFNTMSKLEIMFDDEDNPLPPEYFFFSDYIPWGSKMKVTFELVEEE